MRKASASAKAASVAAESQELSSGIIPKKLMQYLRAKQREMRCPKWVESKRFLEMYVGKALKMKRHQIRREASVKNRTFDEERY